ncbi:MAG: tetratricopeptide repeat protein [Planctomycetota bacterium]|nr:tetratricopeptide repeat protein [Planctomycetota bacterium]
MNDACRIGRTWVSLAVVAGVAAVSALPARAQEGNVDPAVKQLVAANGLFQQGLPKLAAEEYEAFLKNYPSHAEISSARYGLAICRYQLNDFPEAIKHLQILSDDKKFKQRDEVLAVLGHCLLATKQYPAALKAFDALLEEYPASKHAEVVALNRAQVLYLLERPADSLKACKEFLKKYSSGQRHGSAEYFQACSQMALNDTAEAEKTLKAFLKDKDNTDSAHRTDAMLLLGQCLEARGQLEEAVGQYNDFVKAAPADKKADGYYSVGLAQYKAKKYPEAVEALTAVVTRYEKSPYVAAARLQLGLAQLAAGQAPEARATLEKVKASDLARAGKATYWLIQCDMAQKNWGAARTALEAMAKTDTGKENAEAVAYDKALCAMELGQFEPAAKEFAEFVKTYPASTQAPEATYRQAFCLHKLTRYAESQALCEKILASSNHPMAGATRELAAENLFLLNKHAEAGPLFRALLGTAQGRQKQQFALRLGQCEFLAGRYDEAVKMLAPVVADPAAGKDQQFRDAAFFLGDAQFQAGQFADSAKTLQAYLAADGPRKEEATFKLGLAQLKAAQTAEAEKTLAKLSEAPAGSPWVARGQLAYGQLLYRQLNQPDKAAGVLGKVLDEKAAAPADLIVPASYLMAWIDFDSKRYDQAAARFAAIVDKHNNDPLAGDAAMQQAICLKEAGKNDEAYKILQKYEDAYPGSKRKAEARQLAATCVVKKDPAGAVKLLAPLADKDATCTDTVLYELAWAYRDAKDNAKAIEAYKKLVSKFSSSKLAGPARVELAGLLYVDKKYDEAATLAQEVIADGSAEPKIRTAAQYRLGWCLAETDKQAQAAKVFVNLVEASPTDPLAPSATFRAGVCFASGGAVKDAQKWLSDVIEKYPNDEVVPAARLKLGEVQAAANEWDKSAATYKAFLGNHPNDPAAYKALFGLGWAMENQGKYEEARALYVQVTAKSNTETAARAQFQIGEGHFAQKQYEDAIRERLKVSIVYNYPEWSAKAHLEAGRAFEALNQPDQAKRQYSECVRKAKGSDVAKVAASRLKALGGE